MNIYEITGANIICLKIKSILSTQKNILDTRTYYPYLTNIQILLMSLKIICKKGSVSLTSDNQKFHIVLGKIPQTCSLSQFVFYGTINQISQAKNLSHFSLLVLPQFPHPVSHEVVLYATSKRWLGSQSHLICIYCLPHLLPGKKFLTFLFPPASHQPTPFLPCN